MHVQGSRRIMCPDALGKTKTHTFDQVLFQASQKEVFEVIGMPMVDNCMAGYNSSIFAYGQVRVQPKARTACINLSIPCPP